MEPWQILLLVLLLFPVFFGGLWCGVVFLLATAGGWRRLARSYPASVEPHGEAFLWQMGHVGGVPYRHTLNIHMAPTGMFLSVPLVFRIGHPNLFFPWGVVHGRKNARSFLRDVTRFQVGDPPVALIEVPAAVFATMER